MSTYVSVPFFVKLQFEKRVMTIPETAIHKRCLVQSDDRKLPLSEAYDFLKKDKSVFLRVKGGSILPERRVIMCALKRGS